MRYRKLDENGDFLGHTHTGMHVSYLGHTHTGVHGETSAPL